jgi:endonuclease/exonuclease/phosphatase family metal-dependent hydrolase
MRVLTWNVFHGRSVPDVPRSLLPEFGAALAGWAWDVALLQEVPPWWPRELARVCGAEARVALTSRNLGLPVRRAVAERRPDVIKSNGGGANAILVRGGARVAAHEVARVRVWPERRVVHAVRLEGLWVGNLHASTHPPARVREDLARAGAALDRWSAGGPALLGGDCNLEAFDVPGYTDLGGHRIDRFLGRGVRSVTEGARTLDPGGLSDHLPVVLGVG